MKENMMITQDEFVKREIAVWGEDYVYDLIDRDFTPVLLNGNKWVWKFVPVTVKV
jgi:hypothetical protein